MCFAAYHVVSRSRLAPDVVDRLAGHAGGLRDLLEGQARCQGCADRRVTLLVGVLHALGGGGDVVEQGRRGRLVMLLHGLDDELRDLVGQGVLVVGGAVEGSDLGEVLAGVGLGGVRVEAEAGR